MPSMESSLVANKKQDDICGMGVPALKRVGVAWVKYRPDNKLYVSMTDGMSDP